MKWKMSPRSQSLWNTRTSQENADLSGFDVEEALEFYSNAVVLNYVLENLTQAFASFG